MNKLIYAIAILSSILVLGGCSKDNDENGNGGPVNPVDPTKKDTTILAPSKDFTIYRPDSVGTATKPSDWVVISDIDPTGLMLVTMDAAHMPATVNEDDCLSAFVGKECRGVVSPKLDTDSTMRFSIVVNQCADEDCAEGQDVQLRYYSAVQHRIFLSESFKYQQSGILGSTKKSFYVNWK